MVDLLTVGASVLELTPRGSERLETADRLELSVTGPESNAAVMASRLGTDCVWASKLPDTPLGRRVVGELHRHGVESTVCWGAGRQGLAFAERGAEPRDDSIVHDRAAAVSSLTPDELPLSAVGEASMASISGATAALLPTLAETATTVFEQLGAVGTTTVCSLSRPRAIDSAAREAVEPLFSAADVLVTTEAGAATLENRATPTETVHALAAAHEFETVVLARGARGALVWDDTTVYEHVPPKTHTVDERGVFDALCGGFLSRRLAGESPDRALAAGVACAALARTTPGPVPVVDPAAVDRCVEAMDSSGME